MDTAKKFLLSAFIIVTFAFYTITQRPNLGTANIPIADNSNQITKNNPAPAPSPAPTPAPSNSPYKDGTYVGASADAFYGNVQIQVTIAGGKLTNVQFLSYPNDRNHSIEINSQAIPLLKSEAIQAQSANVDIISGATETSSAFQQSLASALGQAAA